MYKELILKNSYSLIDCSHSFITCFQFIMHSCPLHLHSAPNFRLFLMTLVTSQSHNGFLPVFKKICVLLLLFLPSIPDLLHCMLSVSLSPLLSLLKREIYLTISQTVNEWNNACKIVCVPSALKRINELILERVAKSKKNNTWN